MTPGHAADSHDLIRVHGARENNLKDVNVELPKRRLTVFTGVSGSGQELAGLRHDRRRVAAADQRDLQRVRAGLHADPGPTRRRRARRPDDGDHRRPGADGRRPPLHRRHRHRRQRDAAHPVQPPRPAPHRPAQRVLVQRPVACGPAARSPSNAAPARQAKKATLHPPRRHVPALRGPRHGHRHRPDRALRRRRKSLNEGALTIPGYSMDGWYGRIFRGCGFFDPDKPIRQYTKKELHDLLHKEPTKIKVEGINLTYEGLIPTHPEVDAVQGRRRACSRTSAPSSSGRVTFTTCPDCDGTRLSTEARAPRRSTASASPTPARCRSATSPSWVRDLDEPSVAPLLAALRRHPRLLRRDRARLPRRSTARPARCPAARRSAPR